MPLKTAFAIDFAVRCPVGAIKVAESPTMLTSGIQLVNALLAVRHAINVGDFLKLHPAIFAEKRRGGFDFSGFDFSVFDFSVFDFSVHGFLASG
jgi:hypothetical protein